jgi:uncharacterized integral membrane protein (TIGR00697 family)
MASTPPAIPRSLFLLSLFYGGMVCIAGVLGNKQVFLGPISEVGTLVGLGSLTVEAGIFAFLLLVVTASAVAELYGRATANRMVFYGFIPLITSILLALFVLQLKPAPFMTEEARNAFQLMMGQTWRIWIAGILAYGVSQTLNVTIFSALKAGRNMVWFRAAIASVLSQIADTLIFITVAFFNPADGLGALVPLLAGQMLIKIVLSLLIVPWLVSLFVAGARRLDG